MGSILALSDAAFRSVKKNEKLEHVDPGSSASIVPSTTALTSEDEEMPVEVRTRRKGNHDASADSIPPVAEPGFEESKKEKREELWKLRRMKHSKRPVLVLSWMYFGFIIWDRR